MKLVISTQYLENYGAHDWDGEGECPQHWKAKGGSEYIVENVPADVDHQVVVDMAGVEHKSDYAEEYIIGWGLVDDDYIPRSEQLQLEYEGVIVFREPRIDYTELNDRYQSDYNDWSKEAV